MTPFVRNHTQIAGRGGAYFLGVGERLRRGGSLLRSPMTSQSRPTTVLRLLQREDRWSELEAYCEYRTYVRYEGYT